MAKGKQTCKILKEIRKQIAEENDIELITSECTYQGDCLGTCPKCESEVRYLEHELEKRQRIGKAAVFAGMSIGTMLAASACGSSTDIAKSNPNCPKGTEVTDDFNPKPLAGDVEMVVPAHQEPDTNIIINPDELMGIFPMYRAQYAFDAGIYQKLLKEKFVFSGMEDLSVVSGLIEYEYAGRDKPCESLEEVAEAARQFKAPYYSGGEEEFRKDLAAELMGSLNINKYVGDMEVAFTVDPTGVVDEVKVVKGIDKTLDAAVIDALRQMRWNPGECEMKSGTWTLSFGAKCVKKIHFPIK